MGPICKYIFNGVFLPALFLLSGCIREVRDDCPGDMFLGFFLDDRYDPIGNYDTRVANEVLVYVFHEQNFLTTIPVPYEEIENGREYVYRKYDGFEGNLDLVACSVSRDADGTEIPDLSEGGAVMELSPSTRVEGRYRPASTDIYIGNLNVYEKVDDTSRHKVPMGVGACRVEVNLTDLTGTMAPATDAFVEVSGTMTRMTMNRTGTGAPAVVLAGLGACDGNGILWNTGRFGILPSSQGQTVKVGIYKDGTLIKTLDVPRESLPEGARSGGLMIFDYTLGDTHYYLTIDGFTEKIVIVDEI